MTYLKRLPEKTNKGFTFFALHHFYWGIILMLIGFEGIFSGGILTYPCIFLGLWWACDDVIQHLIQGSERKHSNGYYSAVTFWHWWPYELIGRKFRSIDDEI